MDISDGNIDFIIDATHGVGHMWESIEDDNTIPEGSKEDLVMFDMIVKASWNERWYCHRHFKEAESVFLFCSFFFNKTANHQQDTCHIIPRALGSCQLINEALCDVPVRDQVRAREHRNHSHSTSNTGSFTIQASIDYVVRIFTGYGVPYRFRPPSDFHKDPSYSAHHEDLLGASSSRDSRKLRFRFITRFLLLEPENSLKFSISPYNSSGNV
uniref:Uncharacterized protein n=1 Tax=Rhizophagus irregularis (strain DAOM 181602 / DAOM 197198 / MUCL 43194) TaxID=747089 RepID=U9TVW8_RHIID